MISRYTDFARKMRKNPTDSEKILWNYLRNKSTGDRFLRQFVITFDYDSEQRAFIADFFCSKRKLVIEIDGIIHEFNKQNDLFRDYIIKKLGYRILRFTNNQIENNIDQVLKMISDSKHE